MLAINQVDINKILNWIEVVQIIEEAFKALSLGKADIPLRTNLLVPSHNGMVLTMPGYIKPVDNTPGSLAVKIVNVFNNNPVKNLPLIHGLVVLFNAETGQPLSLFDGGTITALRTGAASGVATKHLARLDASVLALFGAGVQAETQLLAMAAVRPIKRVNVFSRNQEKALMFCNRMQDKLKIPVNLAATSRDAVENADIIVTATTSSTPVFQDKDLLPGVHINGVGSYTAHMREVPGETVARAAVVVDAINSAMTEAGDLLIPIEEGRFEASSIYAEIGEICAGLKSGREALAPDKISFFKSVGNAVQDVAIANYLYSKAVDNGLGQVIEL